MAQSTAGRVARVTLVGVCTLAIAALVAGVVQQAWRTNGATSAVVDLESKGAEMLHPMTTLLAELVAAQSAAVRGEPVDAETLRKALAAVAEIDQQHGVALQTTQRLTSLTAAVDAAVARAETGRAAYDTYSGLVTLAGDLFRRIGDTSHLIHDPDLDSYYLMDAAIIRLPDAMVLAGRAADLVVLAGGVPVGEDAIRVAVARFGVSNAAEEVNSGLTKSVDFTARSALGANIAERLDAFKAATDAFAPPTMLVELSTAVDPQTIGASSQRVAATANPLAHRLLSELEALLEERAAGLGGDRQFVAVATTIAGVIALALLWMVIIGRPRQIAATVPRQRSDQSDDLPMASLTYARDLLDAEDLAHASRAAGRARTRGGADAG